VVAKRNLPGWHAGRVPVWPGFDCTVVWTEKHVDVTREDPWLQRATRSLPSGMILSSTSLLELTVCSSDL
jgi:hypothetical protein